MKVQAFTILEILTATVIFSIVVSFVYSGYFTIQESFNTTIEQKQVALHMSRLELGLEKEVLMCDAVQVDSVEQTVGFLYEDSIVHFRFNETDVFKTHKEDTLFTYPIAATLETWQYELFFCMEKGKEPALRLLNSFKIVFEPFEEITITRKFYKHYPMEYKFKSCFPE